MADEDALEYWAHLALDLSRVQVRTRSRTYSLGPNNGGGLERTKGRPNRYWVTLWYLSMGWREKHVAQQLQISQETVKQHLIYARRALGLKGAPIARVVAVAIRKGIIP
jgi:DNA-binding NarL/FixJ family response regulator